MLVPPLLPVTFALAMTDDVVSSRNSDSNRKSQPGILNLTTDHPDGPWELSDLWTRQKPKPSVHPRKCICKSKAFISQMEAGVSTVCEERERERGFLEGGGRPSAEAQEHVYKPKARQVLFPTPITSHITLEG